jgi:hypothetical protein
MGLMGSRVGRGGGGGGQAVGGNKQHQVAVTKPGVVDPSNACTQLSQQGHPIPSQAVQVAAAPPVRPEPGTLGVLQMHVCGFAVDGTGAVKQGGGKIWRGLGISTTTPGGQIRGFGPDHCSYHSCHSRVMP